MSKRIVTGNLGEDIAAEYLIKNNYKILARNWKHKMGELDIICEKNNRIIFIEVKAMQKNSIYGHPLDKVNYYKLKKVQQLAELFLIKEKYPEDCSWQIDVISIELDYDKRVAKLTHLNNV